MPRRHAGDGIKMSSRSGSRIATAHGEVPGCDPEQVALPRAAAARGLPAPSAGISRTRQLLGAGLAVLGLAGVSLALAGSREQLVLSTPVLLMLIVVVAVAIVGGIRPALPAALAGFLLLTVVFTEPYGTFDVHRLDQGLALLVYTATAVSVSVVVGIAARRHQQALRAAAEAAELSVLAGAQVGEDLRLRDVLDTHPGRVRPRARCCRRAGRPAPSRRPRLRPEVGGRRRAGTLPVSSARARCGSAGRALSGDDRRVLSAFARAAVASLERQELREQAAEAVRLASVDQLRTALAGRGGP